MRGAILATCVLLEMGGAAMAENTTSVQRFECMFDKHVSTEISRPANTSPLRIEFMVDGTGHAFAVGRNVYPVKVIPGSNGVTFLEVLVTGAVQTTTMNTEGKAAHSRHTILAGELIPSQYYGTCE